MRGGDGFEHALLRQGQWIIHGHRLFAREPNGHRTGPAIVPGVIRREHQRLRLRAACSCERTGWHSSLDEATRFNGQRLHRGSGDLRQLIKEISLGYPAVIHAFGA